MKVKANSFGPLMKREQQIKVAVCCHKFDDVGFCLNVRIMERATWDGLQDGKIMGTTELI